MLKTFNGNEISEQDYEKFRRFVDSHYWKFAKTYASFCPHEYSLRRNWNKEDYDWFVKFIWNNGFYARWGKNVSKYFVDEEGGWYYFVFPVDIDEHGEILDTMTLINRGSLGQWEFVKEDTLFEEKWRCVRLPKERRTPIP